MAGIESLDFEEDIATGRSSRSDTKFDTTVGHLEDIIMEEQFQSLMNSFMEKHYQHFDDVEENKLIYTNIFKDYVNLVEKYIHDGLSSRIPGFSMDSFVKSIKSREDQIGGDIFDMLTSFADFLTFKQMMLDYKAMFNIPMKKAAVHTIAQEAMKEGTSLDLDNLLTVTPAQREHDDSDQDMQVDPQSPRGFPKNQSFGSEPSASSSNPSLPPDGSVQ